MTLTAHEQDIKTQAQVEAIAQEIKTTQPLTSQLHPIASLPSHLNLEADLQSNKNGQNFMDGCRYLATQYTSFRAIRGDGNCYYRAFLYSLCEKLLRRDTSKVKRKVTSKVSSTNTSTNTSTDTSTDISTNSGTTGQEKELKRIQTYVNDSLAEVTKYGYDQFTIEMFHDELVDLMTFVAACSSNQNSSIKVNANEIENAEKLHEKLNEENATSDYCTWFLRVITSAYLKKDAGRFVHFLDDPNYFDVPTFCQREVDPMGKECGMVQVLALAEAFGVRVVIEYLDGNALLSDGTVLMRHTFGADAGVEAKRSNSSEHANDGKDDSNPVNITLLYRPGHYDILY